MDPKIYYKLSDLPAELTSHNTGLKRIFLSATDTKTALTQFAYGTLACNEAVETHLHPTMEEFYYFLSGKGSYEIGETTFNVEQGVFIRVPNNTLHSLKNQGEQPLEFIYFSVAC